MTKRFNVFDVDGTIFLEDHIKGSYHIGEIENVDVNCLNDIADRLNELNDEKEALKMYKDSVSDVLLSWSQKNLTAKQLQVVIAIMEELNVKGDVE